MSGRGARRGLAAVVAIAILAMAVMFILQGPIEPAEKPWLTPPAGQNDLVYSNDTTFEGGNNLLGRLGLSTAVVRFATYGRPVLLYGDYNSPGGLIDFFIIDDEGYSRLLETGGILTVDIAVSSTSSGGPWGYILQPVLNDDSVDNWYVVYSAYTLGMFERRAISATTGQDRTAPMVQFDLANEVNETVEIPIEITESRGDIALVRCYVDDQIVEEWFPMNSSFSPTFIWDTEAYANGEHWFGVYVEDRVGNGRARWLNTTVNNTYPQFELPREINFTLTIVSVVFIFIGAFVVFIPKNTKKGRITLSIVLMILSDIWYVTTEYAPGPWIDIGLSVTSLIGISLTAYSVYSGRKEAKENERRFREARRKREEIERGVKDEGRKTRKHITDKTRELRKKMEETSSDTTEEES